MPIHSFEPHRLATGRVFGLLFFIPGLAVSLHCEKPLGYSGHLQFFNGGAQHGFVGHCIVLQPPLLALAWTAH
jgi:hypothetical protein